MAADLVVVGAGAIGLSIAWCAARRGARVIILERGQPGRESSWAAAGILPYGRPDVGTAYVRAMGESARLHPVHAALLRDETGIAVEYREIGEILTELDESGRAPMLEVVARQEARGAPISRADPSVLDTQGIAPRIDAYWLPRTAQINPPRYLAALEAACRARGVEIRADAPVVSLARSSDRITGAVLESGEAVAAGNVVVAAGAWTPSLVPFIGEPPPIRPLRGQIALLRPSKLTIGAIISVGHEYLVPREDGRVLVGATMEDAGFDARTTAHGIRHLLDSAVRLVPSLADADVERVWAGLRPATPDGEPIVGPVAGWSGLWIAAGHTRQGIHLAPYTGESMAAALTS